MNGKNICTKHGQTNCIACYSPSPEAYVAKDHPPFFNCPPIPSPEARVDWENYVTSMLYDLSSEGHNKITNFHNDPVIVETLCKALSDAFEKGREAR